MNFSGINLNSLTLEQLIELLLKLGTGFSQTLLLLIKNLKTTSPEDFSKLQKIATKAAFIAQKDPQKAVSLINDARNDAPNPLLNQAMFVIVQRLAKSKPLEFSTFADAGPTQFEPPTNQENFANTPKKLPSAFGQKQTFLPPS